MEKGKEGRRGRERDGLGRQEGLSIYGRTEKTCKYEDILDNCLSLEVTIPRNSRGTP